MSEITSASEQVTREPSVVEEEVKSKSADTNCDSSPHHRKADESLEPQMESTSTKEPGTIQKSSENMHEGNVVDQEVISFMLSQLARQLEYYLSAKNLSKDTYVQTLRNLNDGCIPVSILANFTKVKGILLASAGIVDEPTRRQAVQDAARQYSTKLCVANIDTKTGKQIVSKEEDSQDEKSTSPNTIVAIGTVNNEPIVDLSTQLSSSSSSEFANAIVMRDVAPEVTAEQIHALFQYEGCPRVISITPDVANCWFVELDTASRSDVMAVLLQLRSEMLAGYPVHARIKTSVAASSVPIDPAPWMTSSELQMDPKKMQQMGMNKYNSSEQNRRKKKSKSKKKNGNNNNNNGNKKGSSPNPSPNSTPSKKKNIVPPPPALSEDNFPTLLDNRVEWETAAPMQEDKSEKMTNATDKIIVDKDEKLVEDDEDTELKSSKMCSDSASTATTTSSSTEPGPKKIGYAAALKKVKPDEPSRSDASKPENQPSEPISPDTVTEIKEVQKEVTSDTSASVSVKAPVWVGGRSFADILRQPQAAS